MDYLAVHQPNRDVADLRKQWCMIESLHRGTLAMREAGKAFLPQWPGEQEDAYKARLLTATLFPSYKRTVGVMSGKPFAKPLALKDAPDDVVKWAENIDLQGVSLHSFAAEMFEEVVGYGLAGILVEHPVATPSSTGTKTKAQVEASGNRPYFVRVKHDQILGWRAQMVGGRMKLTQLRILESTEQDVGLYGTVTVPQVRVLMPGGYEVHQPVGDGGEWQMVDQGLTTLSDIPYVPLYGLRESFMIGLPPMIDLAYLNVKHWQSQSDQDTILHVARVPILAMVGADDQTQLTVGGSSAVKLPMGADMKFIEHTGAAIKAGADSLTELVEQMIQTGAELTVKKPGAQRTASQDNNEAEANKSDLQRMAENFEDALDQALVYMADFAKLPKPGSVKLFSDYGAATMGEASATLIKDLHIAGIITGETAIKELQRRGVVSDDVDPGVEFEMAKSEVPPITPPTAAQGDVP